MWTDSHCHLQYEGMAPDAVERAAEAGVTRIVCVGTDAEASRLAIEQARARPGAVWATAGLHPHDAARGIDGIEDLLGEPEVVAVGECGLDYHYDHSPRPLQRRAFAEQVAMAKRHGVALVVHTREAWDDTFEVLSGEGVPERTVFHCFTGGPAEARRALDLGGFLSFSGIVTFRGADELRRAAALRPGERMLVETDAPFLAPAPHRGQPNQPAYVAVVGEAVAAVRGAAAGDVAAATWENAEAAFSLR
jgi:TatD DNase family protein